MVSLVHTRQQVDGTDGSTWSRVLPISIDYIELNQNVQCQFDPEADCWCLFTAACMSTVTDTVSRLNSRLYMLATAVAIEVGVPQALSAATIAQSSACIDSFLHWNSICSHIPDHNSAPSPNKLRHAPSTIYDYKQSILILQGSKPKYGLLRPMPTHLPHFVCTSPY